MNSIVQSLLGTDGVMVDNLRAITRKQLAKRGQKVSRASDKLEINLGFGSWTWNKVMLLKT